jgi:RNA polymerase-binding transcription factor DksA
MASKKSAGACKHPRIKRVPAEDEPGVTYKICEDCGAIVGATSKVVVVPGVLTCPCCGAKVKLVEHDGEERLEAVR